MADEIIREIWAKGKSVSCPILDMHAHMFNDGGTYMIAKSPESVIENMDKSNVRAMTFVGHSALFGGREGIARDLALAKQYPDRFRLYYPVLSNVAEPDVDLAAFCANPEYVGLKFLADYYETPLSAPVNDPYWRFADERRLPVLCHTWGGSIYDGADEARKVMEKYPNLTFIAGHTFRDHPDEGPTLCKEFPNLYLELTAVLSRTDRIERILDAGFVDRIVFGADSPWFSYDFYIGALLSLKLSDDEMRAICYRNAVRAYERAGMKPAAEFPK